MTREEAIQILKSKMDGSVDTSYEWAETVRMAIEALNSVMDTENDAVKTENGLIKRQDAIDALGEEPDIWNDTEEEWAYRNAWVEHISAIKSLPSADITETEECRKCQETTERVLLNKASAEDKGDLISRHWLLDLYATPEDGDDVEWKVPLEVVRQNIVDAPSADAVQGWIPCSERLPDVGVEVLTTTYWSDVLIGWLKKCGAWETEEYILANDEILAWMPLPKPYREDGEA